MRESRKISALDCPEMSGGDIGDTDGPFCLVLRGPTGAECIGPRHLARNVSYHYYDDGD